MSVSLELATTDQLLKELFSRTTFAGVIVYSPSNHRFAGQLHPNFNLMSSCEDESIIRLLEQGLETMRNKVKEDGP